jgi:hypothetical protein
VVDATRVARAFGIVVLSLVAVLSVAVLALVIGLHFALQPPDVEDEAHSSEAQAARAHITAVQDATLAAFAAKAPGATSLATSIEDACSSSEVGMAALKAHVSCSRTTVRYLAVDGDRTRLQSTWDRTADDTVDVKIEWTERPTPPPVYRDFDRGMTRPAYDGQVMLAETPVDKAKLYHDAYARHRYVVALSVGTYYYPGGQEPSRPGRVPGP